MDYGIAGNTTGYNTHVAGTGGYGKIVRESETSFSGASKKNVTTYKVFKLNNKYYVFKSYS